MESAPRQHRADLVLEGGGVKGVALVGAVVSLAEAGYAFPRIAGTSSGAVVGSVLAALERRGEPATSLREVARSLDYARFRDRGVPGRYLGPLSALADAVSLLTDSGVYEGDYLRDWNAGVLRDLGVETFGDLRRDDPDGDRDVRHDYRLVVTASDVSRRRLVRLPWDYAAYGLDPDEQRVADAVRASASIPYFFEPVTLHTPHGDATFVDGGVVSNYPIGIFDRSDDRTPRWPTVGVRLTSRRTDRVEGLDSVDGPVPLAVSLLRTALEASQADHVYDPCNIARSIYVDTDAVGSTDFGITAAQRDALLAQGGRAAADFLDGWDYERWLRRCRGWPGKMGG